MSGHETRMLLLGAVALFEPVNGYQIRRELLSWQVEDWAHVNPGSIYSGLATLTRQEHLVRHDLVDGTRDVAVYEMTPTGTEELARLMATSLETVDLYDAVAFHAAFSMLPLIQRQEAIAHLDVRLRALEETIAEFEVGLREKSGLAPPHALHAIELQMKRAEVEREVAGRGARRDPQRRAGLPGRAGGLGPRRRRSRLADEHRPRALPGTARPLSLAPKLGRYLRTPLRR